MNRDFETENDIINDRLLESEEQSKTREIALQKAQNLIKKLNDECERTVKDLVTLEQNNELLKRQNRELEKDINSQAKNINQIDSTKKIEERIRAENAKLKEQLRLITEEHNDEIHSISEQLQASIDDKQGLENALDILE